MTLILSVSKVAKIVQVSRRVYCFLDSAYERKQHTVNFHEFHAIFPVRDI